MQTNHNKPTPLSSSIANDLIVATDKLTRAKPLFFLGLALYSFIFSVGFLLAYDDLVTNKCAKYMACMPERLPTVQEFIFSESQKKYNSNSFHTSDIATSQRVRDRIDILHPKTLTQDGFFKDTTEHFLANIYYQTSPFTYDSDLQKFISANVPDTADYRNMENPFAHADTYLKTPNNPYSYPLYRAIISPIFEQRYKPTLKMDTNQLDAHLNLGDNPYFIDLSSLTLYHLIYGGKIDEPLQDLLVSRAFLYKSRVTLILFMAGILSVGLFVLWLRVYLFTRTHKRLTAVYESTKRLERLTENEQLFSLKMPDLSPTALEIPEVYTTPADNKQTNQ